MPTPWQAPPLRDLVPIALASGLGPLAAVFAVAVTVHGEAFWILPTLVLETPAAALGGAIAVASVCRCAAPPRPAAVWLVQAVAVFGACALAVLASVSVLTAWVAAPLAAGAVLGAVPAAALASQRVRAEMAK